MAHVSANKDLPYPSDRNVGWKVDPSDSNLARLWDGESWTEDTKGRDELSTRQRAGPRRDWFGRFLLFLLILVLAAAISWMYQGCFADSNESDDSRDRTARVDAPQDSNHFKLRDSLEGPRIVASVELSPKS